MKSSEKRLVIPLGIALIVLRNGSKNRSNRLGHIGSCCGTKAVTMSVSGPVRPCLIVYVVPWGGVICATRFAVRRSFMVPREGL